MAGLLIIGLAIAYITLFWYLAKKAKNRGVRIAVILVALLIPLWEFPIGFFNFQKNCSKDSGVSLISKFPSSSAVLIDLSAGYTPSEAARYGFRYIEYKVPDGVVRYTSDISGLTKSSHPAPISTVVVERAPREKLPWNLDRTTLVAKRLESGIFIGQQVTYHWGGLWWQIAAAPMFGGGVDCGWNQGTLLAAIASGSN